MSRPDPPENSEKVSQYYVNDKIYYFRSGKWREGEIKGQGGSSDDSPRYLVTDIAKGDERLVDEDNIRMKKY